MVGPGRDGQELGPDLAELIELLVEHTQLGVVFGGRLLLSLDISGFVLAQQIPMQSDKLVVNLPTMWRIEGNGS